MEMDQP